MKCIYLFVWLFSEEKAYSDAKIEESVRTCITVQPDYRTEQFSVSVEGINVRAGMLRERIWTILLELPINPSRRLLLSCSLVKNESVHKFTSWEQQELWKEVSADVAGWKGPREGQKESSQPSQRLSILSFSFFLLYLGIVSRQTRHAGMQLDCENTDARTDGSVAAARATQTPAHVHINGPRGAWPTLPSLLDTCKDCVVLMYLLCCVFRRALKAGARMLAVRTGAVIGMSHVRLFHAEFFNYFITRL